MYTTRELISEKFWIVDSKHGKVGTIRKTGDSYEFFDQTNNTTKMLESLDDFSKVDRVAEMDTVSKSCNGFPTNSSIVIVGEHETLPVFYKKKTSRTLHGAGYYIIKFEKWLPSFCPKLNTLEKYTYQGPFLTKWDMNLTLKKAKKES